MRAFIVATAVSAVLAVWGAAGAATLDLKPPFTEVGSRGGRILFETSEFKDQTVRRIIYSDLWQREEYAYFSGNGAQAEAIYAAPKKPRIAMQFLHDFERIARSFRHIRGRPTIWDNEGEMSHNLGKIRYRIFYLPDKHRSCFIFKSEWSDPPDDPGGRAGSILFGYYCARPGIPLTAPIVSSFLIVINIQDEDRPGQVRRSGPENSATGEAIASIARGGDKGKLGNIDFPFRMAAPF